MASAARALASPGAAAESAASPSRAHPAYAADSLAARPAAALDSLPARPVPHADSVHAAPSHADSLRAGAPRSDSLHAASPAAPDTAATRPRPPPPPLPDRLLTPTFGLRNAPALAPADPARDDNRVFRSYPDRLADLGWIADTDFGYSGLERYLFAPGSPRPPSMSLDGFPVDLGSPATTAFDGWDGVPGAANGAWWPDGASVPGADGALDFQRHPAGPGRLATRFSLHGGDPGHSDARISMARRDAHAEWAFTAGVDKNQEVLGFIETPQGLLGQSLLSQFRERGLSAYASRETHWGRWRAAVLSSTADVGYEDSVGDINTQRRELLRAAAGASLLDSILSFSAVVARQGDGTGSEGREGVTARVRPRGLSLPAAVVLTVQARDTRAKALVHGGVQLWGEQWEGEAALEAGDSPHAAMLRVSGGRDLGRLRFEGSGRVRAGLSSVAGSDRLFDARLEPGLSFDSPGSTAGLGAYWERGRGLDQEAPPPRYSLLLPADVRSSDALGLRGRAEFPFLFTLRVGGSGFVQRTRTENSVRLPYQPPYDAQAYFQLDRHTPWIHGIAHLRLVAHAMGERQLPDLTVSPAHMSLDFEGVLEYESMRFDYAAYDFTDNLFLTTVPLPGGGGTLARAYGRIIRFGIRWDLAN